MVGQALLLLADVEFFDIVDQLLLQTVLVVFHVRNLFQSSLDTGLDLLYTSLFIGLDVSQQLSNIVNLLRKLLLKGGTLLFAEVHETFQGIRHSPLHDGPLLVLEYLHIRLRQHIGHTGQGVQPVLRLRDTHFLGHILQLVIVVFHEGGIHRGRVHRALFLYPHTHVHFSADQSLCHHRPALHLLLTIERGNTGL